MDYSKMFDYRPFEFWDTDPYIELCFDFAFDKLKKTYPGYLLLTSDCFGISVVDSTIDCCEVLALYSIGRLGKVGPLAMRNERTKEMQVLCLKDSIEVEGTQLGTF